jgi:hypothetical protein
MSLVRNIAEADRMDPSPFEIVEGIRRLKQETNAVILAHYYQSHRRSKNSRTSWVIASLWLKRPTVPRPT